MVIWVAGMPGAPGVELQLLGTPARCGYRPVINAAREGEHTGAAE